MTDPIEPAADDHPSLVENVARHPPHPGPAIVLAVLLALLGVWLTLAARAARAQTHALERESAAAAASASAEQAQALTAAGPLPSATIDSLAQHMPAHVSLASVEGRPGGAIRIAVDTPDPDQLRQALGDDPWFDRFRERGQEQHDDGSFRVTLESR